MNQKHSHIIKKINKVIVKQSITFYSKAWVHRNEIIYDNRKYHEHMIEWYRRIVEEVEKGNKPSLRWYVTMQKLDIEKSDTSYIRLWNETTVKMMKQAKRENVNDIRNYFLIR